MDQCPKLVRKLRSRDEVCTGKQKFVNPTLAWRVARKMRRKRWTASAYRCAWCKHYHVGVG